LPTRNIGRNKRSGPDFISLTCITERYRGKEGRYADGGESRPSGIDLDVPCALEFEKELEYFLRTFLRAHWSRHAAPPGEGLLKTLRRAGRDGFLANFGFAVDVECQDDPSLSREPNESALCAAVPCLVQSTGRKRPLVADNVAIARFDRIKILAPKGNMESCFDFGMNKVCAWLQDDFPGAWDRKFTKPYRCPFTKRVRRDLTTESSKIAVYGEGKHSRWSIVITDRLKHSPDIYHLDLVYVGECLEELAETYPGEKFHVSQVELCLDVPNGELADKIVRTIYHPWSKPERTFNFHSGQKSECGSPNGFEQYQYARNAARQFHDYYKAPLGIHRFEMTLTRPYLKEKKIETIEEMFENGKSLIEANIRFIKLNRKKLLREFPQARGWKLTRKQPISQISEIQRHIERLTGSRLTTQQVKQKYFKEANKPTIIMDLFEPDDVGLTIPLKIAQIYEQAAALTKQVKA
jgi:hypothetical protein